ncbi:hypothetical protein AB0C84_35810 [Actinomadura sp. NPDC048955]|uniref:hypothetical protein n=1 Tax=Actinomadura sp. NPDC048955 TaxID=3158228 RepID=UPI0033C6A822
MCSPYGIVAGGVDARTGLRFVAEIMAGAVDETDPAAGLGWGAAAIVRDQTGRDQ